jgi:hypothetical protein
MTPTDHQRSLLLRLEQLSATHPAKARQLVSFAWTCVHKTALSHLRGRCRLQKALLIIERWLNGEPVEQRLQAMHDDVFEAALGVGRFEAEMIGLRAACWSVFELYQAALAVTKGELGTATRKAAWAASLAARSSEDELMHSALEYQERLLASLHEQSCSENFGIEV